MPIAQPWVVQETQGVHQAIPII